MADPSLFAPLTSHLEKGRGVRDDARLFLDLSLWTLHLLFDRPNLVLNLCPARFQTTTGRLDTMEPNSVHGVGERREGCSQLSSSHFLPVDETAAPLFDIQPTFWRGAPSFGFA